MACLASPYCGDRDDEVVINWSLFIYLSCSAAVQSVVISDANTIDHVTLSLPTIHLVENRPETIRCAAFGGYPPPSLDIYIGGRDVTNQFQYYQNATMSGRRGLRHVTYRSDRWKYDYTPLATDDQAKLQCVATVTGIKSYVETVQLSVDCTSIYYVLHLYSPNAQTK